jgi:hypothetical protein
MDEVDALLDRLAREREESDLEDPAQDAVEREHTDHNAGDGPGPAA